MYCWDWCNKLNGQRLGRGYRWASGERGGDREEEPRLMILPGFSEQVKCAMFKRVTESCDRL